MCYHYIVNLRYGGFINEKLKPKGYIVEDAPIFNSKNNNYKKISFDDKGYTLPVYDFMGTNSVGNKFYAYIISPAYRTINDSKYYEIVSSQMINIINSIQYSEMMQSEKQIEIIFVSFSARVNEFVIKAQKIINNQNLYINPYLFNIKISK